MSKLQALSPSEGEREKKHRVRAFGSGLLHQTQPRTRPSFPLSSRCGRRGQGRGGTFPGRWCWLANTGTPLPSPLPFRRGEGEEAPRSCVWLGPPLQCLPVISSLSPNTFPAWEQASSSRQTQTTRQKGLPHLLSSLFSLLPPPPRRLLGCSHLLPGSAVVGL